MAAGAPGDGPVTDLAQLRLTIVGLGLMGGSLAGALRGQCRAVVGVDCRAGTIETARSRGLVDRGTTDLATGLEDADLVVLATPVRTILRLLDEIGPLLPPGCLVMDLGSTKAAIVANMARLPGHVQALGGHPMCGKERSGIAAADPALYRGCTFILCPLATTSAAALARGKALARAVEARPLVLPAGRHDFLAGTISHLPYLLACALVGTADATTSPDPAVWEIVAGGFRDTSRVSAGDVTMWVDILLTNREEVGQAIRTYQAHLDELAALVEAGDEEALRAKLEAVRKNRLAMF